MYYRTIEDNKRLKKLYKKTFNSYGNGAYYDKDKERYIKYCAWNIPYKKSLKKQCQKKVRRMSLSSVDDYDDVNVRPDGGLYKRCHELWWNLL